MGIPSRVPVGCADGLAEEGCGVPTRAVIFGLDGVLVTTDEMHYRAWLRLANEEGIPFDWKINDRLRGISREASLEVLLQRAARRYTAAQKTEMADRKNHYYLELLEQLTPADMQPGALAVLGELKERGVRVAVGSGSTNAPLILHRIGLAYFFDAVAHGNEIRRSKPDPEVFLLAASRLGVLPPECLVIEDADAGVRAAIAGGMKCLAVGAAAGHPLAHQSVDGFTEIGIEELLRI
jgi:beta-phosphoglucomutase